MIKHTWDNSLANAWKNFKAPLRPSICDIKVFEKYLNLKIEEKGRNTKVLILGSTPELRDLINLRGLTAYVCDYNKNNYKALKLLKKTKGKEVFINQDWRTLKLKLKPAKKFNLIFAEASLNMVKKEEVPLILKNVKKLLGDNGLFIAKTWTTLPKEKVPIRRIIYIYRKNYKGMHFYSTMARYIYSWMHDMKKNNFSVKDMFFRVKKLYEKGILTKKEFSSFLNHSYENSSLKAYMPPPKECVELLGKYMIIKRIIFPKPIGINKLPIFVLGKRE